MAEQTIPASEARDRFAELLEMAEKGRVAITKHGEAKVFLISVRELMAMEETLAILEDENLTRGLKAGLDDIRLGRLQDARDTFAELDAEFRDKEG